MAENGVQVVLTASATEMSDYYNNPFVAFVAGFGKGPIPLWLLRRKLYPPVERNRDGTAKYAPYGLRKVEALLLENGFKESEVAVVHPQDLGSYIGAETKVVGISTMDPTGMGYVSKTYSSVVGGGEPMNAIEFKALVKHRSIRAFKPRVIVGGFGSWQLERMKLAEDYGVDCLLIGSGARTIVELFRKAVKGDSLPTIVQVQSTTDDKEALPGIKHAAIHGAVEISKGCGRNCQFCTPTMHKKVDIPLETIMDEVKLTVKEGSSHITLVTEDIFLYGASSRRFVPNRKAVFTLIKSVTSHQGVKNVQPSHMSLAPVVSDPKMVKEVAEALIEHNWYFHNGKPIVTGETGIETGSTRLMEKFMRGKPLPYSPQQWKEVVTQSFGILNDCDWYPLATLIVGLPEENESDVLETLELLDDLKSYRAFYVPLFFVPLENCILMDKRGAGLDSLTRARWDFLVQCWESNISTWRDTFLQHRVANPLLYNVIRKALIPFAAKLASVYYGMKRGRQMKEAILRMATI